MKTEIIPVIQLTPEGHDSDDVYFENKAHEKVRGYGYRSKDDGRFHIRRCPSCGKENYAMAVAEGPCCWCGYNVTNI